MSETAGAGPDAGQELSLAERDRLRTERRLAKRGTRVVDAPLVSPSADNGLVGVFQRRYLLRLLVQREVSARYQDSLLGMLWSYLNPLTQFFLYWFVMGKIVGLDARFPFFAIHVFAGLVIVSFFTETLNAGTRSIVRNKALVQKMAMPRELFPVASMLVSLYHGLPELAILVIACFFFGWSPDPGAMLAFTLAVLICMAFGTGFALVLSIANVFLRDMGNIVNVTSNFIRFGVPMMYPYSLVADRFHGHTELYLSNPIAIATLLFQRCFWTPTAAQTPGFLYSAHMPDQLFQRGWIMLGAGLVFLVIAQMLFTRFDNRIPERLE